MEFSAEDKEWQNQASQSPVIMTLEIPIPCNLILQQTIEFQIIFEILLKHHHNGVKLMNVGQQLQQQLYFNNN